MNYNEPLQYLSFVGLKSSKAIFLRSSVNILAKQGTTFSRKNVVENKRGTEKTNTGTTSLPDFVITYNEVVDNSRSVDGTFKDIIDIALVENVSFPPSETTAVVRNQLNAYFANNKKNELRVLVRVFSDGPTGKVTTTIAENADIDID